MKQTVDRKWHLLRKGFATERQVAWQTSVLERLLSVLESSSDLVTTDWSGKRSVKFFKPINPRDDESAKTLWAEVQTKRVSDIELNLYAPTGRFALGAVAHLGSDRRVDRHDSKTDVITITLVDESHVTDAALAKLLRSVATSS